MNFYEFYQLLKENTVSQELKKFKQNRLLKEKDIIRILTEEVKKIMFPPHILPNINQNSKSSITNWILFNYFKEKNKDASWLNWLDNIQGKIDQRNAKASIDDLQYNLESYLTKKRIHMYYDYIAYNLDHNGNLIGVLADKFNNSAFTINDLKALSDQYHQEISFGRGNIPGAAGETILSFPDGYKWVDLKKGYCEREGRAGLHCGNVGRRLGDTILSLRDSRDHVYLTFILNNGVLIERKGKQNLKPKSKYHPYIIELLKLPIIKNIDLVGRHDPANDFQLDDLNEKQLEDLLKIKPEFKETLKFDPIISKMTGDTRAKEKLTQEEINILINSGVESYKQKLISHIKLRKDQKISLEHLTSLAKDNSRDIRLSMCNVMYLPTEIYEILSEDNDDMVRYSVGANPSTPTFILDKLAKDNLSNVRAVVASSIYTRVETLNKLSEDKDETVRYRVARNRNTKKEILNKLAEDESVQVRKGVANNPNLTENLLNKLSEDKSLEVLDALVNNHNLFKSNLSILVSNLIKNKDPNSTIILKHLSSQLEPVAQAPAVNLEGEKMRKLKDWIDGELDFRNMPPEDDHR